MKQKALPTRPAKQKKRSTAETEELDGSPPRKKRKRGTDKENVPDDTLNGYAKLSADFEGLLSKVKNRNTSAFANGKKIHIALSSVFEYRKSSADNPPIPSKTKDLILQSIYNRCIATKMGQRYQQLLKSYNLHTEDIERIIASCIDKDGQRTDAEKVGVAIPVKEYRALLNSWRECCLFRFYEVFKSAWKTHLKGGAKEYTAPITQNDTKSDHKYKLDHEWLKTCEVRNGQPFKKENAHGSGVPPQTASQQIYDIVSRYSEASDLKMLVQGFFDGLTRSEKTPLPDWKQEELTAEVRESYEANAIEDYVRAKRSSSRRQAQHEQDVEPGDDNLADSEGRGEMEDDFDGDEDGFISSLQRRMIIDKFFMKNKTEQDIKVETRRRMKEEQDKMNKKWFRPAEGKAVFLEVAETVFNHISTLLANQMPEDISFISKDRCEDLMRGLNTADSCFDEGPTPIVRRQPIDQEVVDAFSRRDKRARHAPDDDGFGESGGSCDGIRNGIGLSMSTSEPVPSRDSADDSSVSSGKTITGKQCTQQGKRSHDRLRSRLESSRIGDTITPDEEPWAIQAAPRTPGTARSSELSINTGMDSNASSALNIDV